MSTPERLQAIEHQLQSLHANIQTAADREQTQRDSLLKGLNQLDALLADHTDAAKDGYRALYNRTENIYREVHLVTLNTERLLECMNSTNPNPAKDPAP